MSSPTVPRGLLSTVCFVFLLSLAAQCAADQPSLPCSNAAAATVEEQTEGLQGKVMVGYQGWFNCEGDGSGLGWKHWARKARRPFAPGNVTVDLWPDLSEYDPDERFPTGFQFSDGTTAEVFSSARQKTVERHFHWMRQYGIDGAFVQRFANQLNDKRRLENVDRVLSHVRSGARKAERKYAVMYDLSGLRRDQVQRVLTDWQRLCREQQLTEDEQYLRHRGKPLVAVWGIGFSDNREYTVAESIELIRGLKSAGLSIMLGVPSYWRDGKRDAVSDPRLTEAIKLADVVSPWTVGRYRTPTEASRHGERVWKPDVDWCRQSKLDFLPVVYPGFSWHNLTGEPLGQIPRLQGRFFWSQVEAARSAGCEMLYVAMFDEVDEATAIFKCTNKPPIGDGVRFLDNEGVAADHYLRLTGEAGKLIRGQLANPFPSKSQD